MLEALTRDSLIGMTGGFIVWSLYFVAMYAWLSVGCVAGWDRTHLLGVDTMRFTLAALTLMASLLIACFGWRSFKVARHERREAAEGSARGRRQFMALLAAALAGLALVSTFWVGAPLFLLAPCS